MNPEPCDFPWCTEPAVLINDEGDPLIINGMRVCRTDLALWMWIYNVDVTKGLYELED